mmetsp:Transcript_27910/g.59445  ORF Transcript_27910/g.59445 Transcript_27910/m.59445 type:complete len:98 (+) Transcript_27910:76-369(+)
MRVIGDQSIHKFGNLVFQGLKCIVAASDTNSPQGVHTTRQACQLVGVLTPQPPQPQSQSANVAIETQSASSTMTILLADSVLRHQPFEKEESVHWHL